MKKWNQLISPRTTATCIFALSLVFLMMSTARAEEHRGRRHEAGEPYRAPHWIYDDRYHHSHYYPAVGYSVAALPPGYISLNFGSRPFFFHGGVWFAPAQSGYAVVRPPIGVIVPMLPPAYTMVWIAGVPYYYANDIYYTAMPGGFAVAAPPVGATYTEAPPNPAALPAPPTAQSAPPASAPTQQPGGMWYYCDSSKAYYPYVAECKEPWRQVPATPPQSRP